MRAAASRNKPKIPKQRRFGGRGTATGVGYEQQVAASISVHMLCGAKSIVWDGVNGNDIAAVRLQTPEAVDDVVVSLAGIGDAKAFVSAKYRGSAIPLTKVSAAFVDSVEAFVAQFATLPSQSRDASRLIWAIPSSAGAAATRHLPAVLDAHRGEASDSSLANFINARAPDQRRAFERLREVTETAWLHHNGKRPTESELREFLRIIYVEVYDFGTGLQHERSAEKDLRTHVVAKSSQSQKAWRALERIFASANRSGLTATAASLRRALAAEGIELLLPPDYAADIERLRQVTERNLQLLQEHSLLPFRGPNGANGVHLDRIDELNGLITAVGTRDLLLTGEPGCGKSGLVHDTANAFRRKGTAVVLLLAEEMARRPGQSGNLLGLDFPLVEVLANWADGEGGILITDALDAVRDAEAQREIRTLLRELRAYKCGWKIAASVREFDLKHSRELREGFPGEGVAGHSSADFIGVSHFHLGGLSDDQLDELGRQRPEIVAFLDSARANPKSASLHKSPFYLRLAAELLSAGVAPARVADWNSPAMLLRKFWENRVGGEGAEQRISALGAICKQMVKERTMVLSAQEISLSATQLVAVNDLRSRAILQSPSLLFGDQVGAEAIRFSHHLLHDYAIARAYIPTVADRFCKFARADSLLPIFYRQSFVFALEEIWDADPTRKSFWAAALELEGTTTLHGLSRILAPIIAARRVEHLSDLEPLLEALSTSTDAADPAQKALRHLASGLQDAAAELIIAGVSAWSEFLEKLSHLFDSKPFIEGPVTHILARLDAVGANQ